MSPKSKGYAEQGDNNMVSIHDYTSTTDQKQRRALQH
jgi:hypothetical protein